MLDEIKKLEEKFFADIANIKNKNEIEQLRIKYLARKGALSELFDRLSDIPKEVRPKAGETLNNIKKRFKFPPHRPFFSHIMSDDQERIYIIRQKSVLEKKESFDIEIFSKNGYYLYHARIPYYPNIINKGNFYTVFISEDTGEELVKRFKIKNWKQIKKRI